MLYLAAVLLFLIAAAVIVLDLTGVMKIGSPVGMFIGLTVIPHEFIILGGAFYALRDKGAAAPPLILSIVAVVIMTAYWFTRLHIKPYSKTLPVGRRVRALWAGKEMLKYSAISAVCQVIWFIIAFSNDFFSVPQWLRVTDSIFSIAAVYLYIVNGALRVLIFSYRLGVVKRTVCCLLLPIPVINIAVLIYMSKIAGEEYDHEVYKVAALTQHAENQSCKTRYPILMVHGVGFRDLKYFNYWGRIPKELIRCGATVYYGNQEAFGRVEYNAEDIKKRILQIVEETGCEKVNIIAHSKGGLDSRYAAGELGMAPYIASLTTICTPHHGSQIADEANSLPDSFYRRVAKFFDNRFRSFGDNNPDFYGACHQFTAEYAKEFNEKYPAPEGVYCQSYASVMKNMWSFGILMFPYLILRKYGENDGLVTAESAKWENFRGVFRNKYCRGISHGDMIDLKREDFRGFDPVQKYVEIVGELKEKGF